MANMKFADDSQRSEFGEVLEYILTHYTADLGRDDVTGIYRDIYSGTNAFMPDKPQQSADVLGKLSEAFYGMIPSFLNQFEGIEMCMFQSADIKELNIPKNIKYFSKGAFIGANIGQINYEGTKAEWNKISKASGWNLLCDPQHTGGDNKAAHRPLEQVIPVNCIDESNIYKIPEYEEEKDDDVDESLNESMTQDEVLFKRNVLNYLAKDGFPAYANYLEKFHFNFLTSAQAKEKFVAAMIPNKGVILINPNLDESAVSVMLRHEAAHQIFKHLEHMFAKLKEMGIDTPSEFAYEFTNIVGDYHISNYIYDKVDRALAKKIKIENLEEVQGLVTEFDYKDHPEYWKMDFDQLWDILVKDYNPEDFMQKDDGEEDDDDDDDQDKPEDKKSDAYVEGWNALVDAYINNDITVEQVKKWYDDHFGGAIIDIF